MLVKNDGRFIEDLRNYIDMKDMKVDESIQKPNARKMALRAGDENDALLAGT